MTFIVKSRWGMFVEPTAEKAKAEADYINERDKGWDLKPTAVALDCTPIGDAEQASTPIEDAPVDPVQP